MPADDLMTAKFQSCLAGELKAGRSFWRLRSEKGKGRTTTCPAANVPTLHPPRD